jgi:hypothetical protein
MSIYDGLLDEFLGKELRDIYRVVVQISEEQLELTDTAVFAFQHGFFQLQVDVHEKRLLRMKNIDDILIQGDYDDRTGFRLQSVALIPSPFLVAAVHIVAEVAEVEECVVGAFLADHDRELMIGINFHLDDVEVGPAKALWEYVGRLVPNARLIAVRQRHAQ